MRLISSVVRGLLLWSTLKIFSTASDTALDEPFSSSFTKLSHAPCVTLFHRMGRTGCGTESRSQQKGYLQYFDGSLPQTEDNYVAVMEDYSLTANSLDTLSAQSGSLLQGILVLNSTSQDNDKEYTYRSPDAKAPQGYGTPSVNLNYGYYSYPWNSKGQNLFSYDLYGVPMAYVKEQEVSESLRQEAQQESSKDIMAEFNYYMGADGISSNECLAWKDKNGEWSPKCLPLGGTSVWATGGSPKDANSNNARSVVIVGTGMDATSMFHDIAPGANAAASNILALLMAAKLVGANVEDQVLDNLSSRLVFGFFQGETYGFVGSRAFLKDVAYPGFACESNRVFQVPRLGEKSEQACLYPLRHSLAFHRLGQIAGMLTVDQVGHAAANGILYVHADKDNDDFGSFLASVLKSSSTSNCKVASTSAENGDNGYPYPPTPLTSLLSLSGGSAGGAVLTGYDYAFTNTVPYHSHMDSDAIHPVDMDSIAGAATLIARAAIAAAYDGGNYDSDTSASYAYNLIPELSSSDETLVELADCLLYNGECDLLKKYATMEAANERSHTGVNVDVGQPLGTPPNYYVSIYNRWYGQPFVQVGDQYYGAYEGDKYGNSNGDAISLQPNVLESAIHGLLNDFLGRGTPMDDYGGEKSCKKLSDCDSVEYCYANGDKATCSGSGTCVCSRAHYHIALDEALVAAKNKPTGYFDIDENDQHVSAMYTEPFWSPSVGIQVYRNTDLLPGLLALATGLIVGGISLFAAFVLRVGLKKQKLY